MFSLKLQGRVIICCIFQANCFLRQTFFFMKKHSPLLNVKWSFPIEYQCPYWLKTCFKYELSELHDTTGTINVAKYIYPSGTPGVTDCFLSCYARFSSFVFCFLLALVLLLFCLLLALVYSIVFWGLFDREVKVNDFTSVSSDTHLNYFQTTTKVCGFTDQFIFICPAFFLPN
jgi:hypothetical protein